MGVIGIILLVLFIIASLLLIFVVAIQSEGGTGLGGIFGGGSDSTFGSQSTKVLTKITSILAGSFLVLAILLAVVNKSNVSDTLLDSVKVEQVQQTTEWWTNSTTE